jgi:hypothetical protein
MTRKRNTTEGHSDFEASSSYKQKFLSLTLIYRKESSARLSDFPIIYDIL